MASSLRIWLKILKILKIFMYLNPIKIICVLRFIVNLNVDFIDQRDQTITINWLIYN